MIAVMRFLSSVETLWSRRVVVVVWYSKTSQVSKIEMDRRAIRARDFTGRCTHTSRSVAQIVCVSVRFVAGVVKSSKILTLKVK